MRWDRRSGQKHRREIGIGLAVLAAGIAGVVAAWRLWRRYAQKQAIRQSDLVAAERKDARKEGRPQPGDILLFYRPARDRDYLIRWCTRSPFYHAALFAGEADGMGYVIEARPQGVIYNNLRGRENSFVIIPAPENKGVQALAWARTQLGAAYDHLDPLTILLEHIFVHWHINYVPHDRYTCAEFVATAYKHAGVTLVPGHGLDGIDPADVANHFLPRSLSAAL